MNPHFKRDTDDWSIPDKVYARVDHVELAGPGSTTVLVAFDAVDAAWFDRKRLTDSRLDLEHPKRALDEQLARPFKLPDPGSGQTMFDDAPLFRFEVEHPLGQPLFGYENPYFVDTGRPGSGLGALEAAWFVLETTRLTFGSASALVYPSLFGQPRPTLVRGTMPSVQQGLALSNIFSLANLPALSATQVANRLSSAVADLLAVYNVGQGSSNALLSEDALMAAPTLYFDLGAGVYRNWHTTPTNLFFCFTLKPPIVLSHWDADHWAGAFATSAGGAIPYPALTQEWIAPLQNVGPVHVAFAHEVLAAKGSVSTYTGTSGVVAKSNLKSGQALRFMLGTGSDRNNTGIVASVEDHTLSPKRSWVLTGDCDYGYFLSQLNPDPPVALVVPHHGANLASGTPAPQPVHLSNGYRRVLYSFGVGNMHGSTQHPTVGGVALHSSAGWKHGAWSAATSPGTNVAGADVLATANHGGTGSVGGALGGCLVGWGQAPALVSPPCAKTVLTCTTALQQA